MPEPARDDYLRELDAVLPFPDARRAEVVEEIAAHLDDAIEDGLSEEAAQRRLGSPIDLARDLARPEQSAWRLLAGVGAAVRSGIGHWLYGYLLGSLLILALSLGAAALVQLFGTVLGTGWNLQTADGGWNTMLVAMAAAVGLYYAGRVIPARVALASRRLEPDVRPWSVAAATVAAAAVTTLVVDMAQNLASVVALGLAPAAVALGAYRPGLVPAGLRAYAAIAVLALAVPIGLLLLAGGGATGGAMEVDAGPPDRNLAHIGPWWPGTSDTYGAVELSGGGWSQRDDGTYGWEATFTPGALDGLRDLRLEAWRTHADTFAIDTRHGEPFSTAVPVRDGTSLNASIELTNEPGVTFWDLVLTGVGRDGVRYVVEAGAGGQSTFTGSAWDWLKAVIAD